MLLFTSKNFAIFFALATTAFCVSTIVLAVQKAELEDDLQDALDKLDLISSLTTTQSPVKPPTTTTSANTITTTTSASITTTTTTFSTPVRTTPNIPTLTPDFPTLPTGLPNPEEITYRLPNDLRPIKYRLYWKPNWESKTCDGDVSIQIEIDKPTNLIVMHAKDLQIDSISILNTMARIRIRIKSYYLRPERELLIIELEELLRMHTPYLVSISFECNLNGLVGMYASTYLDENKNQRWIATSKFEPTYARMAFPCFDEPSLKAMFTITVVRPTGDGYHALSNMNIESENELGDLTEVHFAESVPMSTYLACFIISDFAFQKATVKSTLKDSHDFEMRVFSTAAQVDKVKFALETGVQITEYYITYFNVAYPLPKLDMAAIPDFVSGAMEHWGLVTFRETSLLYDPDISSSANKQRVASVIAHELAHMWFGNLVTMKWWNDLWLNEGFASYIQYKGVDKVNPTWNMLDQFLISDLHGVLKFDATLASHPIIQTVENPNQITELFDSITYSKGASIIRMLESLVGEENFKNATTNYLNKYMFSNAETEDYLDEIEGQELGFDVKLIMQTWTEQMGFPVVEVTKNGNLYKLTQKRFLSNPEDYSESFEMSRFNYRWSIPITYYTNSDPSIRSKIFNYDDNEVTIDVPNEVEWIKFNKNQVGYYRVNYDDEMWSSLINALVAERGMFSNADRAHLINDAFSLADASQLKYEIALNLLVYLEKELDYVPWNVGSTRLNAIKNLLYYTDLYSEFADYTRKLLTAAYDSVTWDVGEDHLQNLLRVTILNTACSFGYEPALTEAASRFGTWLSNPSDRPDPDIRSIVYYYGMQKNGNEKIWNEVWKLFINEQDAQEKVKLMESLAAVREPWILQQYINLAWDENNVRSQDYFNCLQYISKNPIGQSLVWDYVRENWSRLVKRFGINDRYLGRMIPAITARFASQTKLEEMEVFFTKYPEAGAGTTARKEALETVKYNIKWLQNNKEQISSWLKTRNIKK